MGRYSGKTSPTRSNAGSKNKLPSADIGKDGMTMGETSTEGGQYPFMPPCDSYDGSNYRKTDSGQSDGTSKTPYPFLPEKAKPIS